MYFKHTCVPLATWLHVISYLDIFLLLGGNLHWWHRLRTEMHFHLWVNQSFLMRDWIYMALMWHCLTQACPLTASEGERQKREVVSESDQAQLLSLGPLLLGKDIEPEDTPSAKLNASKTCSAQRSSLTGYWQYFKFFSQCFRWHCICSPVLVLPCYWSFCSQHGPASGRNRSQKEKVCEAQIDCNLSQ